MSCPYVKINHNHLHVGIFKYLYLTIIRDRVDSRRGAIKTLSLAPECYEVADNWCWPPDKQTAACCGGGVSASAHLNLSLGNVLKPRAAPSLQPPTPTSNCRWSLGCQCLLCPLMGGALMPDNPKIADYYEHRMVISKRRVIFASRLLIFATNQLEKLEASISATAYFSLFLFLLFLVTFVYLCLLLVTFGYLPYI